MKPALIVEALDVIEQIGVGFIPCGVLRRWTRSFFKLAKKLSIAALSQQSPRRLMLQAMPLSANNF